MEVAKVVQAWETAKGRSTKMIDMEVEAEQRKEPKRVPTQDHKAMKRAFEAKHWKLSDETVPSNRFMEKRIDMIEKNEWKAEPLSEVLAVTEDDESHAAPKVDSQGNFVSVRVGNRVQLPKNPE